MQSVLLPELPSDTSQALNQLVVNLNKFNETFSENTSKLGNALKAVNESYAIQANVIQAVHDMDLMKMAQANVKVLRQLQECTDKLEGFNEYLNAVEGYTEAIYRFQTMFDNEADRLHVLEEIRDFFQRHKAEIAKTAGSADLALQSSLTQLRENASSNVAELHNRLAEQSEEFKRILNQEKEGFEELMSRVNAQFADQMQKMPAMARQLEQISSIPDHLESLVRKIEQSNAQMASQLSQAVKAASRPSVLPMGGGFSGGGSSTPAWMKWTAIVALVIIAAWCVGNAIGSIFSGNGHAEPELVDTETVTIVEPAAEVPAETEKMDAPAAPEVKVDSSATAPAQPAL